MFSLISFLLYTATSAQEESNLKQLIILWRHGDRSPVRSYPNYDKHFGPFGKMWPKGPGQLTVHGMKQHYELGEFFKARYGNFIPDDFSPEDIYIQSTDVDRTLMSAQSNIAGMFPAQNSTDTGISPIISPGLFQSYQPLPVHSNPVSTDILLRFPIRGNQCPEYDRISYKIGNMTSYKEINAKFSEFLSKIQTWSGFTKETLDIRSSWEFSDALLCSYLHNATMPEWFYPGLLDELNVMGAYGVFSLFSDFEKSLHTKVTRLNSGNLIEEFQNNIRSMFGSSVLKEDPNAPYKLRIYSAHDTTIEGLLVGLDLYNFKRAPYASSVFFEIYEDRSIKGFYRNDTKLEPYELQLCKQLPCTFDQWEKETAHLISDNWEKECGLEMNVEQRHSAILLLLLIMTYLVIGSRTVYRFLAKRQEEQYRALDSNSEDFVADI